LRASMSKNHIRFTIDSSAAGDRSLGGHPPAFAAVLENTRSLINVRFLAGPLPTALREEAAGLLVPGQKRALEATQALPTLAAVEEAAERRRAAQAILTTLKEREIEPRAKIENPALWTAADGAEQLLRHEEQLAALGRQAERQQRVVADAEPRERAAFVL
jgi:hypothetical protein